MIMARALKFAEGKLRLAEAKISGLQSELDVAQPKADFYDTFVSPNKCTGLRDTAKELGISERKFVNFLIDENIYTVLPLSSFALTPRRATRVYSRPRTGTRNLIL